LWAPSILAADFANLAEELDVSAGGKAVGACLGFVKQSLSEPQYIKKPGLLDSALIVSGTLLQLTNLP
jgi:hypothetical protein